MGSTRLPGKVMLEAAGKPLLGHLVERLQRSASLEQIIIATSTSPDDQVIADFCDAAGIAVFRGSNADVLDRYFQAATRYSVHTIVRVTSDCPLIDPELIDEMVPFFLKHINDYDLVTNRHPLTFPDGIDFDIMSFGKLQYVWQQAWQANQREHVIPYFWESGMRVFNFEHPERLFNQHRWTLDYPEDYVLITQIIDALYREGQFFSTRDILNFLARNPELPKVNSSYIQLPASPGERHLSLRPASTT